MMNWLQAQLQATTPPELILHLGAGSCRELADWLKTDARRVVLVEPNPELLPELRARSERHDSVEIIAAAIAGQSGRGAVRLFNFPTLSSLREPTGLYQSLPGLRQIGRAMVETLTIDQLLDELDLNAQGDHWLVIDTPGEEAAILDQLQASERLYAFSRIFLSAGAEVLYQGAESATALIKRLEDLGYHANGRPDCSDGDWPRYHLALNRLTLECRQVWQELEQSEANSLREAERANALAAEREQLQSQLAQTEQAHNNELHALSAQLAAAAQQNQAQLEEARSSAEQRAQEHQAEIIRLREEHAKAVARLETERDQATAQLEQARAELQSQREAEASTQQHSSEQIEQLQKQLSEKDQTIAELTQKTNQLSARLRESQDQVEEHAARVEMIQQEIARTDGQIDLIKDLLLRESLS